jgi:tryptophan halogenase
MNHAIAFPTEDVSDLKPYTLARALSSGWNWRIATQSRYGNGYVFSDEFQTVEQAIAEVQSVYTEEVKVAKDIKFEAGRVDKFWINNCLSIGLSSSFVEPLEASSIGNTILQSFAFCEMFVDWTLDRSVSDFYNEQFIKSFDSIVDFIQLHYITKRNDSEFWRALPSLMEQTDFLKEHLDIFKKNTPSPHYFWKAYGKYYMFNAPNWGQVMSGLGLYDKDYIKRELISTYGESIITKSHERYEEELKLKEKDPWIDHKALLESNKIILNFERN